MRSSTDYTAPLRGGAVGTASGAVAALAHGIGGGAIPHGSALSLLFAACGVIGGVAATLRPRHGLAGTMALLGAGQAIAHLALSLAPGHHQHAATPAMLIAHLLAIPVGALAIRAAESGMRRAVTGVRRVIVALGSLPEPVTRPARRSGTDDRAEIERLLVTPNMARRGPPGRLALPAHRATA